MHWWGPLERGSTWVQVQMHHHQWHSGWWSCQRGIDVESCWSQYIWFEKHRTLLVADCLNFLQLFWLVNGSQFATCSYKDLQVKTSSCTKYWCACAVQLRFESCIFKLSLELLSISIWSHSFSQGTQSLSVSLEWNIVWEAPYCFQIIVLEDFSGCRYCR